MRKIFTAIVSAMVLISSFGSASAHPGRTDANGGHTCRTNCGSWGYGYGEYHYHGGGSSSSGSIDSSNYTAPKPITLKPTPVKKTVTTPKKVIVAINDAPVYSKPAANPSYLVGTVPYGMPILEMDKSVNQGWYLLQFANTQVYLSKNSTTSYTPSPVSYIEVAVPKAYLFSIPSPDGKVRASLLVGQRAKVIGISGDFYYVEFINPTIGEKETAFIKNTLVKSAQKLPVQIAEQFVYSLLDLSKTNAIAEFDSVDPANGMYTIRVYEVVIDNPQTGEGHTATWGWYSVHPYTGEINRIEL